MLLSASIGTVRSSCQQRRRSPCRWSMIMSVSKCSLSTSVDERTEVDTQRTGEDTGVERGSGGWGEGVGGGTIDGSERASYVATAGSIQKGWSSCCGSRKRREEATHHHGQGGARAGEGVGQGCVCRAQPHPPDRDAGGARGHRFVSVYQETDPVGGGGYQESPSPQRSQAPQPTAAWWWSTKARPWPLCLLHPLLSLSEHVTADGPMVPVLPNQLLILTL